VGQKIVVREAGRYQFSRKRKLSLMEQRSLQTPVIQHAMVQSLGRFPHWDRQKQTKHRWVPGDLLGALNVGCQIVRKCHQQGMGYR
jgi:hypothetical protein